ncbi:hypothetical protein A8924_3108 [Saccharopolyspora erythraea NRRL 2338]|uniref:Uncharacterized protein n=1 Tax=Saccharopolyspora erythraea TaxID=1836 RepID=A0ABN1E1U1_SACER|nr:hypothetical protein A8924_3108 [Saccharopolyspora erythraea NRRL 2338]
MACGLLQSRAELVECLADWHGAPVTSARIQTWHAFWGRSSWRHDIPGWTLSGLKSLVMGGDLVEEDDGRRDAGFLVCTFGSADFTVEFVTIPHD